MLIRQTDLFWKRPIFRRDWLYFTLSEGNVPRSLTGLPHGLWIDPGGNERQPQHFKPRLKVNVARDLIPVSIEDDPRILVDKKIPKFDRVAGWIRGHRSMLMKHWNREINDAEFIEWLKRK